MSIVKLAADNLATSLAALIKDWNPFLKKGAYALLGIRSSAREMHGCPLIENGLLQALRFKANDCVEHPLHSKTGLFRVFPQSCTQS